MQLTASNGENVQSASVSEAAPVEHVLVPSPKSTRPAIDARYQRSTLGTAEATRP